MYFQDFDKENVKKEENNNGSSDGEWSADTKSKKARASKGTLQPTVFDSTGSIGLQTVFRIWQYDWRGLVEWQ